jgi:phospholipid N-methyltransferase
MSHSNDKSNTVQVAPEGSQKMARELEKKTRVAQPFMYTAKVPTDFHQLEDSHYSHIFRNLVPASSQDKTT